MVNQRAVFFLLLFVDNCDHCIDTTFTCIGGPEMPDPVQLGAMFG